MDFALTEEQKQIKQMVREFAESEIKPHLMQWDEAQHFPTDVFRKAGELGMLGVTIPEEYGGGGVVVNHFLDLVEGAGGRGSGLRLGGGPRKFFLARPHHPPGHTRADEEKATDDHHAQVDT